MTLVPADDASIGRAAEILRRGGLVAFPTETVYGLGANAADAAAVSRIFAAKGRPADHPVIVHLAEPAQVPGWARDVPPEAVALAEAFWPGPLTLILPRARGVHDIVTGGQDTVGLRVPSHPVARRLLKAFGGGIAAPSANRFGRISPTTAAHVLEELGDAADLILDGGPADVGIESTIVDLTTGEPRILRPGMISAAEVAEVLRREVSGASGDVPRVSGSLASHYAPVTPARLLSAETLRAAAGASPAATAVLTRSPEPFPGAIRLCIRAPADPVPYARALYGYLRRLDASGAQAILIEDVPDSPEWVAIRDRLVRAAQR